MSRTGGRVLGKFDWRPVEAGFDANVDYTQLVTLYGERAAIAKLRSLTDLVRGD
jgi:hypothetical protein